LEDLDGSPDAIRAHHKAAMTPFLERAASERADIVCLCENALTTGINASADAPTTQIGR